MPFHSYVDSTRQVATNLSGGAGEDLKRIMNEKKMLIAEEELGDGIASDITYLKQAEHLLRTASYPTAIKYTMKALEINPESKVNILLELEPLFLDPSLSF